jgi:hypothetical protein
MFETFGGFRLNFGSRTASSNLDQRQTFPNAHSSEVISKKLSI